MSQMVWDLFGVAANTNTPDADGCVWTVASSDGWDAPDQRTQLGSLTGRDGQGVSNQYADGRSVVIKGMVFAPSENAAWAAYDRITSAMPGLRGSGDIVAQEPTPKSLTVVQAGPPRVSKPTGMPGSPLRQLTYWLTLVADYPWKRATSPSLVTIVAGSTQVFVHSGTQAAEFTATTATPGTVVLTAAGLTLSSASVPAGTVFDSLEHTVTGPGGEDLYGAIDIGSEWPAVSVGSNPWHNGGTARVDLSHFATYA